MDLNLLSVGTCSEYKNHNLIIQSLAELRLSGIDAHYTHIGDVNELLSSEQELAKSLEVFEFCTFLSGVKFLGNYLKEADILIQPSREEGFSLTIAEALTVGTKVIISNRLSHNLAFGGRSGVEMIELDVGALTDALKEFIFKREQEAMPAIELQDNFSPALGAFEYLAIYRLLTRGKRNWKESLSNLTMGRDRGILGRH